MPGFGCSKPEPASEPAAVPCDVSSYHCFYVVAKAHAMATNFLKFCSMGSTNGVAFGDGVLGFGYAPGVGKMYTWSVEGVISSGL